MSRKIFFLTIALFAVLMFVPMPQAQAAHWGVGVAVGPAYPAYSYPAYSYPYYGPAYPAYPYYAPPVPQYYVAPRYYAPRYVYPRTYFYGGGRYYGGYDRSRHEGYGRSYGRGRR